MNRLIETAVAIIPYTSFLQIHMGESTSSDSFLLWILIIRTYDE